MVGHGRLVSPYRRGYSGGTESTRLLGQISHSAIIYFQTYLYD